MSWLEFLFLEGKKKLIKPNSFMISNHGCKTLLSAINMRKDVKDTTANLE